MLLTSLLALGLAFASPSPSYNYTETGSYQVIDDFFMSDVTQLSQFYATKSQFLPNSSYQSTSYYSLNATIDGSLLQNRLVFQCTWSCEDESVGLKVIDNFSDSYNVLCTAYLSFDDSTTGYSGSCYYFSWLLGLPSSLQSTNFVWRDFSDFGEIEYQSQFSYTLHLILNRLDEATYNNYLNSYGDGYNSGHNDGYQEGYQEGKDEGLDEGYESGYQDGNTDGYDTGYTSGYNQGYNHALTTHDFSFTNLFASIGDTPILYLRRLFGFELFGVSLMSVFMSLFTALIVIHLIKKVF